jgi:hypothetical protein
VKCKRQFFLTRVTKSVVIAVFEEVGGGVAGVWCEVSVAVDTSGFGNLATIDAAVLVAVDGGSASREFTGIELAIVVAVEGWCGGNLARVAYAVAVTVGLRWVGDRRAVVKRVDCAVAVGVDTCECDGVESTPRDA